jgi:hypothetical protein
MTTVDSKYSHLFICSKTSLWKFLHMKSMFMYSKKYLKQENI